MNHRRKYRRKNNFISPQEIAFLLFVLKNKDLKKKAILNLLKNLEKQEPKKRIYINLFNSGIVIDTKEVRNKILKHAKTYFDLQ